MSFRRATRVILVAALFAWSGAVPAAAQTADPYFEFLLALHLDAQGNAEGALAALNRAAAADPRSAEVKAEIASLHLRHERGTEAEQAAREALALDGENREAHRVLGMVYAGKVDAENARRQPNQRQTNARSAITHLERAMGETGSPLDLSLHYTLGRMYLRVGNAAKAVEALTRVVTDSPTSLQARVSLAQAHAAANDYASAISTLQPIVESEPRIASMLGRYQELAGKPKEAAESYARALAVQPMNGDLKFRRILALYNAKEFTQAATLAAEAQAQHPKDLRFPRLQARAMFDAGATVRALSILEPTAKAFPKDAATQFALADLYNDAGRDADAERTIRQLLDIEPDNAQALNYLGYLLADRGRQLDEAVRLVQRALESDPDNPAYLDSLGWAHYRRGDLAEAEKYIAPAAERLPRNAVIQDHLGDVLAGRGRWQEAIAAWTRALEGEGDEIDRTAIERKISDARAKLSR